MSKRSAEIVELNGEFSVVCMKGGKEVARHDHLPLRKNAKWHAERWVKEGRYLMSVGPSFKPRKCADKKCGTLFIPKKEHALYHSRKCGDRVRHERAYRSKKETS